ncbi:dehydratase, partial [Acinetobacter baumannii]
SSLGSPGVDEVRWLKPVRPGDSITLKMTVTEVIPSRSRPDRGLVRSDWEGRNQNGDVVITLKGMGLFGRRPAA